MSTKRPFTKKYAIVEGEKLVLETAEQFDECVKTHGEEVIVTKKVFEETQTEIVLDEEETPKQVFDVNDLPRVISVRNKKTKRVFEVQREHFLRYQNELELA